MVRCFSALAAFSLLAGLLLISSATAKESAKTDSKNGGTVGGLLIDVKDDGIIVQVDGDGGTTKYLYNGAVTKQAMLKRNIFNVDRVNIKFANDGDTRKLISIEKVPGQAQGVMIGEVLNVYNNFWVAVKPNKGMIEGFALNWPPEKFKQSHDLIKTLKKGDMVAIKYATDFERHRILQMEVKPAPSK